MKRSIILIAIVIVLGIVIFCSAEKIYQIVFSEEPIQLNQHIERLEPSLEIYKPETEETQFPVVVIVPGCLHTISHNPEWTEFFNDLGYAVVVLDSFSPRGIDITIEDLEKVCIGVSVPGFDRAGDIYALLTFLEQQDWVQKDNIVLAGWSHGGWAVMDAMAFDSQSKIPDNIQTDEDIDLSGVAKTIILYPHCRFGTHARDTFVWNRDSPVLLFIAKGDGSIKPQPCLDWYAAQHSQEIDIVIYEDAQHTYDIPAPHNRNPKRFSEELLEDSKQRIKSFLE